MAPALMLSNFDPIGPAILTALLGSVSVLLFYLFNKEWLSKSQAIIATLL